MAWCPSLLRACNDILMFAWMNREALTKTVESGEAVLLE
jgi:phosphoribosyl-AMP cyclohydrolase